MNDTRQYREKRAFFDQLITLYGRNVAMEVLEDESLNIHKLHLAKSNKTEGVIDQIIRKAQMRGVEIAYHEKAALSRISKNAKQDQGVAIDVIAPNYHSAEHIGEHFVDGYRLLALDAIHNPQNLGMIVRSAAAGNIDGIILPKKNSAKLSPLVIKASAGTLFKIPVYYCDTLESVLADLGKESVIYALSSHAKQTIYTLSLPSKTVFVLGNESEGVSATVGALCDASLSIPMRRGVESLNVAVTAALISFIPRS